MGLGLSEVILMLLSLSGLGVQQNTNAPGAGEVLKYAPDDADAMVYIDAEAVLPGNWKVLAALPDAAVVKGNAELKAEVQELLAQAEGARKMVQGMLGFDPVTDVKSAAVFVTFRAGQDTPDVLAVARGNFPTDLVDKVAMMMGGNAKTEQVDGRTVLALDAGMSFSSGPDGALLVGTTAWVKARAATAWKPLAGKKDSLIARVTATLDDKPFLVFASNPGAAERKLVEKAAKDMRGDEGGQFFVDLVNGHDFAVLAVAWNGVGWTYQARSAAGFERAALASEGIINVLRAGHLATRGVVQLFLSAVDSFSKDPTMAQIAKNRDKLLALLDQWTGDGMFVANTTKDKKTKTVSVKATGKHLSEVLPVTALVLPGAGFFLLMSGGMKEAAVAAPPATSATPAKPAVVKPLRKAK